MPDVMKIDEIREPWIRATVLTPDEYLGAILKLCQDRRGIQAELSYVGNARHGPIRPAAQRGGLRFLRPAEKRLQGLCQLRLQHHRLPRGRPRQDVDPGQREPVDALSMLVHRSQAERRGRTMVEKLKELIPQHLFKIPIQAAIGAKVIARETISALRKDVTAKCYGGDITRKRKLWTSRRRARSGCASSARSTSRRRPLSRP
jgi:GTP-binding protein LepA